MPDMSPPYAVTTARLGALVREQREALGMSMDQLAKQARVSRSSVHRLEHGSDIRPTPSKLGRMLQVVGLEADAARRARDPAEPGQQHACAGAPAVAVERAVHEVELVVGQRYRPSPVG